MTIIITYHCHACKATSAASVDESTSQLTCRHCQDVQQVNSNARQDGRLKSCLICSCSELFVRKDFPQRLGVTIVVIGLALSCVTWMYHMILSTFGILFATALIDLMLYLLMGDVVECYRCHAQYRGLDQSKDIEAFDLEIHERHRQLEARKSQLKRANS